MPQKMEIDQAIQFADSLLFRNSGRHLNDLQLLILRDSLKGQSYEEIAERHSYSVAYIRNKALLGLWQVLSEVMGERISKKNCVSVLERQMQVLDIEANPSNVLNQENSNLPTEAFSPEYALVVTGFFAEEQRLRIEAVLEMLQNNLLKPQIVIKQKSSYK
jgi:hypothetical protein